MQVSNRQRSTVNNEALSTPIEEYDEMIVSSLLDRLRLEGGKLTLDKMTRAELADDGLLTADLRRAINIAAQRKRVRSFSINGAPCIALVVESEARR